MDFVRFTACSGSEIVFRLPGNPSYVEQPPGWGQPLHPWTDVNLVFMDCERVSWGPFERPVQILIEAHSSFLPPDPCWEGARSFLRLISTFATNDTELNRFLRDTYDLHVYELNAIHSVEDIILDHREAKWQWSFDGGAATTIWSLDRTGERSYREDFLIFRLFWHNDTAASYIDFVRDAEVARWHEQVPVGTSRPAIGQFQPPMLLSNESMEEIPGEAAYQENTNGRGRIHQFHDLNCQEPVEPGSG